MQDRVPPMPDNSTDDALRRRVAALEREIAEALSYQTAISDVLSVISRSHADLQPVLDTIVKTAARLCHADKAVVRRRFGDAFRVDAEFGHTPEMVEFLMRTPVYPGTDSITARAALEKCTVHIEDLLTDPANQRQDIVRISGVRTGLAVPLMRQGDVIGVLVLGRNELAIFKPREITLLETFADQAVIAIENARLFEAEQTRSTELAQSLEYQTATSEVLSVISRSPNELQPVLEAIAQTAARLCQSDWADVWRLEDGGFTLAVSNDPSPDSVAYLSQNPIPTGRGSLAGRCVLEKRTIHIEDRQTDTDLPLTEQARFTQVRTMLGVPLMRQGVPIGAVTLIRREVRPFTGRQIELVETFADQAVIAINNVGLFEEVQARTKELTESLEYQTATSEVLSVISRSPNELQPVLDVIAQTAFQLCPSYRVAVWLRDGNGFRVVARTGAVPNSIRDYLSRETLGADRSSVAGRAALDKRTVHVRDIQVDAEFTTMAGIANDDRRTMLGVPLQRDGEVAGVITLVRAEVRPYSERQIKLIETFADQAVIAINNVGLFEAEQTRSTELAQSLEYQTATSEVLNIISRSKFELQPVFDAIVESGLKLFPGAAVVITLPDDDKVNAAAVAESDPERAAAIRRRFPVPLTRDYMHAIAILDRRMVDIPDASSSVPADLAIGAAAFLTSGNRAITIMPMMRGDQAIGALSVMRLTPGSLSAKQVELLRTFADQAVIAIENARLFEAEQTRTKELAESLKQQTATADVLKVISRSALDLQRVLDTLVEFAARLCAADDALIFQIQGETMLCTAHFGSLPMKGPIGIYRIPLSRTYATGRAALERRTIHIPDVQTEFAEYPDGAAIAKELGLRSTLAVPLLRAGEPLGVIYIRRTEVRGFTERQIELLTTFADQAVIAIENARLFEAEQTRTKELRESLEYQTAISDVLGVISRSTFDLEPVLQSVIETAARLCQADHGSVFQLDGDVYRWRVGHGLDPVYQEIERTTAIPVDDKTLVGRVALAAEALHIEDAWTDAGYGPKDAARIGNTRTMLGVPLLRHGKPIGVIAMARERVELFSRKHIDLVTTFADQAMIAIENARLLNELQRRQKELTEALEYQTAMSEVLGVISRSPNELPPVLEAILQTAHRLCDADRAHIFMLEGDAMKPVVFTNNTPERIAYLQQHPILVSENLPSPRAIRELRTIHIVDVRAEPDYAKAEITRTGTHRSMLIVPLIKNGAAIGTISLFRHTVKPFTDKQISLVETFANQAVIAINNVGNFEQVQARTKEVTEALEYQTATSAVLGVISKSPNDLQPVLEAIAETGARLCQASDAGILIREGESLRYAASYGSMKPLLAKIPVNREWVTGRTVVDRVPVHVADLQVEGGEFPLGREIAIQYGHRTTLGIPLLRNGEAIGCLFLRRTEVRPFSAKHIALLQTFADQAVIAISNTELFEEVQARTREVTEALEYQTATSEVLGVISRSPSDLQPVLDAIVKTAARLCETERGAVWRLRDGAFDLAAHVGMDADQVRYHCANPIANSDETLAGKSVRQKKTLQVDDILADSVLSQQKQAVGEGLRTLLTVPLISEDEPIGVISLARKTVAPFSGRQIDLVTTFASQAVIAINNVGNFEQVQARTKEVTEALKQQTATADVLKTISRSAFDLDTVLNTLVESAARLCDADMGLVRTRDGESHTYQLAATYGFSQEFRDSVRHHVIEPGRGSIVGRIALAPGPVHIPDVLADEEFHQLDWQRLGDFRAVLGVPLLSDGKMIGALLVHRKTVSPFTAKQIELVETFADQAVIAINNVRLFEQVQARTKEVTEALEYQTATSEVLGVISRSPNELQPVLDAIVKTAAELCGAAYATIRRRDGTFYKVVASHGFSDSQRDYILQHPIEAGTGSMPDRIEKSGKTEYIPDVQSDPGFTLFDLARAVDFRALLGVPLRRGTELIGVLILASPDVDPFSAKQIALAETFADQAVIAINNVGNFEQVQARTKEVTESAGVSDRDVGGARRHLALSERVAAGHRRDRRHCQTSMRSGLVADLAEDFGRGLRRNGQQWRVARVHGPDSQQAIDAEPYAGRRPCPSRRQADPCHGRVGRARLCGRAGGDRSPRSHSNCLVRTAGPRWRFDRRHHTAAHRRSPLHASARSRSSRPSPTRP